MWSLTLVASVLASNPYLDEARTLIDQLQFEAARAKLAWAKQVPTTTRAERRELSHLLARAWAAEGKLDQAQAAYTELLTADPQAPAPLDAAPRIREAFRKAKLQLYPEDFVSLAQTAAAAGRVELALVDPWARVQAVVLHQARGAESERTSALELSDEGRASAALLEPQPGLATRWYAEATGAGGAVEARLASRERPFLFEVGEASTVVAAGIAPRSRVVPWVCAALAVAAAAVAGGLGAAGAVDMGSAQSAAFASDRRALELRARERFTLTWGFGVGAAVSAVTAGILFAVW